VGLRGTLRGAGVPAPAAEGASRIFFFPAEV
jgi:hypothetical protein